MVVRWTVVALAALVGVLLVVRGYALIGAAFLVGAVARAAFVARWHMHPERHPHRHSGYSDPG